MRTRLIAACLSALAACSTDKNADTENPNVFPANYKQEILDSLMKLLDDPTNVREAYISEPTLGPAGREQRYTVCIRYNARNLVREYVGAKDRIAYFYGGRLNQLVDATPEQCGNAAYKPFPELEQLCFAKKCE